MLSSSFCRQSSFLFIFSHYTFRLIFSFSYQLFLYIAFFSSIWVWYISFLLLSFRATHTFVSQPLSRQPYAEEECCQPSCNAASSSRFAAEPAASSRGLPLQMAMPLSHGAGAAYAAIALISADGLSAASLGGSAFGHWKRVALAARSLQLLPQLFCRFLIRFLFIVSRDLFHCIEIRFLVFIFSIYFTWDYILALFSFYRRYYAFMLLSDTFSALH